MFLQERVSFPLKYGKAIFWRSWRLKSQNYPLGVNHVHDTDLSKLVNLCPVKKNFISTSVSLRPWYTNRTVSITTAAAKTGKGHKQLSIAENVMDNLIG